MKAHELITTEDATEILATADIGNPSLTPPEHITNIAHLAITNPHFAISPEVVNFFKAWVHDQRAIQELATQVIQALEEKAPLPTHEDIILGGGRWPGWIDTWWGQTLRFSWAGRLGEAVTSAWGWLDAQS